MFRAAQQVMVLVIKIAGCHRSGEREPLLQSTSARITRHHTLGCFADGRNSDMARQRTWGPELPVSSLTAHGPFLAWLLGVHIIKQQHDTIHIISPVHLHPVCFVAKLAALPTFTLHRECLVSCLGPVLSRQLFSQSFECSDTS